MSEGKTKWEERLEKMEAAVKRWSSGSNSKKGIKGE